MAHSNGVVNPWTGERVNLLKKLWAKGFSARQISDQMGDISRNAVIGKAHRLKLYRPSRQQEQSKRRRTMPPIKGASRPYPPEVIVNRFSYSILDLTPFQCRWPQGESNFKFCGAPRAGESSYCAEHRALAMRGKYERSEVQPDWSIPKKSRLAFLNEGRI